MNLYPVTMLRLALILIGLLAALPAVAQGGFQAPQTKIELIAESVVPAPGRATSLAIVMTPAPGWHTYWKNPGGAGLETKAHWTLPASLAASPIRYPVPKRFEVSGIVNYVFEGTTALLVDLDIGKDIAPGTKLPIALKLDYLVCDDKVCVPQSADLSIALIAGDGTRDARTANIFDAARAALPRPVDWPAKFARKNNRFRLSVPLAEPDRITDAYFFPQTDGVLDYDTPQNVSITGDHLVIETLAGHDSAQSHVEGVLKLFMSDRTLGVALTVLPGDVPLAGTPLKQNASPNALFAFGFAILGGLLLNIMPCVFPILGLKALSLANGGRSEAEARGDALAYSAGVISTVLALGGLILALRAAGAEIGWAFHLQNPYIIAFLLLLITAITLNLAGLFEIRAPRIGDALSSAPGRSGAFSTGVLAAFVATPCTGPFMGLALGAAIVLPPATGLLIFAGLGLGLALPFLAIGFVPALRRRLPRPGPWLATFRRLMAIPMALTALALGWVLWRQTGMAGLGYGLAVTAGLALALWWLGKRQRLGKPARLAASLALLTLLTLPLLPVRPLSAPESRTLLPNSEAFSETRLATLRAAGQPVFVYFTADWCITCKVNETGVLSAKRVHSAFADAGVVTLVGDWTSADPEITRFLQSQGRAGVPLYLFYRTDGTVVTLPQLLGPDMLVSLASKPHP